MTKDFPKKVILFIGIFLFLLLSSCSWLKKEQVQRQTGHKAEQAQLELEGGNFQKAIDVYKEIYQQYPQDPTVRTSYIKTLESIKSSGDQTFEIKNFELAGNIYEILTKNWFHFADLSHSLSFNENYLGIKIITCRSLIGEKQAGLYLETGDFQRAIDAYKEIHQQYSQYPTVRTSYIKIVESIKSSGDQAFERKNFELAGNIYEILTKNWLHFADLSHSLSFKKNSLEKKIITCRSFIGEKQAGLYLEAGDFQRAIDVYKEIYQQYPQDPKVRRSYTKILESIKSSGDRAFERSDFVLAGCIYQILLKNFSSFNHLSSSFSFKSEDLTKKIKSSKKVLFENGLKQYRSGDLNQAISIWKSILAFDPENQEIKKAVDMAILQSKNLKEAK